ncbi:MAG TPA: hypothetical protein VM492_14305 [Sumerlaeia bacterium]|nr:hypothetical protein [Sumerlaeia bacterium]
MEFEDLEQQRQEGLETARKKSAAAAAPSGEMTLRERFQRTMHYQRVDRLPNFEFGYWATTLENWHKEGLPKGVVDERTAYEYFGIETSHGAPVSVGIRAFLRDEVIEETEDKIVTRDALGIVSEINKHGNRSIPHYLDYPIKDRKTWQPYKEALLDNSNRYPEDWDQIAERYRRRDYPLGIGYGSLIGTARNLIGFENTALFVCTDPELMEDIVETFCVSSLQTIERALQDVAFDYAAGWEDICFNSGPVVGVPFFRNVLTSRYKRIAEMLNLHGVDIVLTDCDGNLTPIAGCLLDGGVNTLFPAEVHGGTDPVALRRTYGRELRVWGGVDKMIFLKDRAAVDRELERLRPAIEEGGFIPTVDHRVQANASLDLYKHYLDRKREWFNVGGEPKY